MKLTLAFFILFFLTAHSIGQTNNIRLDAKNPRFPDERLITAGQPSEKDFAALKKAGVTRVVNLRPDSEKQRFSGSALAKQHGLEYVHIPVNGVRGITKDNAKILHDALSKGEGRVFVHCSSGNRVGALLALRKFYFEGNSAIDAFEYGKKSGLTSLSTHVLTELGKSDP